MSEYYAQPPRMCFVVLFTHRRIAPEWYLNKLEAIQKLVFCLQTQPAYFVNLAVALKRPYERQVLVSGVKQVRLL